MTRIYVARPRVYATQTMPLCRNEQGTDVRIETPFDVMIATLGVNEASTGSEGEIIDCYYTFVDKNKYQKALNDGLSGEDAFYRAVVRYKYMEEGGNDQFYGRVTFNTHYLSNQEHDENNSEVGAEAFRSFIEGDRYLVINTKPRDKDLIVGKEYIVSLFLNERGIDGETVTPGPSHFDLGSKCSKSSTFRIHASGIVKVDGIGVPDLDNISVCENQTPVVQVDVQAIDSDGNLVDVEESAIHDWWEGDMNSYLDQYDSAGRPLYSVMTLFRSEYPDALTWDVEPKGEYTGEMRSYLASLASAPGNQTDDSSRPKLLIGRSSYVFPPVKLAQNQDTTHIYVVAIPIDRVSQDKYMVCVHPQEVCLTVRNNSPELDHGFSDIPYPAHLSEIPLRVGLRQLRGVSVNSIENDTPENGNLTVPVRLVHVVSEGVTALERISEDPYLYLAGTDDPEYLDLDVVRTPGGTPMGLKPIGRMYEVKAEAGGDNSGNLLRMAFDKGFRFKEGHTYRLRFSFRENGVASLPTGDDGEGPLRHCHGQHVLTLKVVPEYQMWVGKNGSSNWSNDANWRRVSTADLLHMAADGDAGYDDFVTDRAELTSTAASFVPLDFTKVIVPAGTSLPGLYDSDKKQIGSYAWPEDPAAPDGIGMPTPDIQYDMAAVSLTHDNVGCRPWYTNSCDQIHFHSNAEITGQHLLSHNRSWVDFEIEPDVWYTLASPLTGVVAGDMYLPTAGARQKTELFQPIFFDTRLNNRFAPAVYQRSWNTAKATVYELGGSASGRNVAVRTTWSNVYNDVTMDYATPGQGFSIKADVAEALPDPDNQKDPAEISHVLFRLPKDDTEYLYFDHNGDRTGHETQIARTPARLHQGNGGKIELTVSGATPGKYFLVGNPFMAHLDMAAFLKDNAEVITGKYWVLNSLGQGCAILDGDSFSAAGTLENPELLPPMQGFFVEARIEALSLTLKFDIADTRGVVHDPAKGNFLRTPALHSDNAATRSAAPEVMRITALKEGHEVAQTVLNFNPTANPGYDEAEDVALLLDSHQNQLTRIYTIGGNMALSVNSLPEPDSTELGVMAPYGVRTTLRFDNIPPMEQHVLYDSAQDISMPLTEGMEYTVEGPAAGRLFIKRNIAGDLADNTIHVKADGREITVSTPANGGEMTVRAIDSLGRMTYSYAGEENEIRFTLSVGVYVLEINKQGVAPLTRKIIIK